MYSTPDLGAKVHKTGNAPGVSTADTHTRAKGN